MADDIQVYIKAFNWRIDWFVHEFCDLPPPMVELYAYVLFTDDDRIASCRAAYALGIDPDLAGTMCIHANTMAYMMNNMSLLKSPEVKERHLRYSKIEKANRLSFFKLGRSELYKIFIKELVKMLEEGG